MQFASSVAPSVRFGSRSDWLVVRLSRFAAGAGAGGCLTVVLWSFWSQWGTSLGVSGGLTLASATGFICGVRLAEWSVRDCRRHVVGWLALAGSLLAAPVVARLTLDGLGWAPVAALESEPVVAMLAYVAALLCVGPTLVMLCVVAASPPRGSALRSGLADAWLWAGVALSLVAIPQWLAPAVSLQYVACALAAGAAALGVAGWMRWSSAATPLATFEHEERRHPWDLTSVGHAISGASIGVSVAMVLQMAAQLQAGMAYVVLSSLGGLSGGVALGLALRGRRASGRSMEAENLIGAGMLLAVASVGMLSIGFGWLIEVHLWLSSTVSDVWQVMLMRGALAALPLVPCGLALILAMDERPHMVRGHFHDELSTVAAACALGFVAFRWWGPEPQSALPWFEGGACVLALVFLRTARRQSDLRRPALIAATAGIALAAVGFWFSDYQPSHAARLLYSTSTFAAYRNGVPVETLPVLDDGRLLTTRSSGRSTWTVWKHHGAQLQFRENGVPRHITSVDLAICPQSSAELLPAIAPLVWHPQPRHVLLTGLGSTATLQACLAFPVETVTCTEGDRALASLAREDVPREIGADVLADSRIRLLTVDPALSAATHDRLYDVIIVAATQPALFTSASTGTVDYFARLSRKLAAGGVLCQRFQYVDLGAAPLRSAAATLRQVFSQVRLLETAPGEVILLATRDDGPAIDPGLAARAQAPHVRRVMSQAGWDWSVLLGLAAVDSDAAAQIIAGDAEVNFAADGRAAFKLAPEVLRWGPKLEEIRQLLAPCSSQMLTWLGPCAEAEEAAQRLADVAEQQRIIHDNPEQPWAYRKALKERLQNRPRSVIVPVSHEGLERRLHPEDQRRKEYLVALGDAARQARPDAAAIGRLSAFVEPYDPLVSYFAHHEAAHLLSRSAVPDRAAELAHRLYTVYYGAGADRSVRNATASLELLLDAPESAATAQARWDQMNSLLDVLRQRWAYRLERPDQSRYAAADVSETLSVVQEALRAMDGLQSQGGVSAADWSARREFLDLALVRPLKNAQAAQVKRPQTPRTVDAR